LKKCIYCDFYSIPYQEYCDSWEHINRKFFDLLNSEITFAFRNLENQTEVKTIYFGGGTPSIVDVSYLDEILNHLSKKAYIKSNIEITIEANPGTINKEKLLAYKSIGVNRISLGIQSFEDEELKFLGRIHNSSIAVKCIKDVYEAGFENLNLDLIFATPIQTVVTWEKTLRKAIEFQPAHISCYNLTIEPNTPLHDMIRTGRILPLNDDEQAKLYEFTINFLTASGYDQYEVSNFARKNFKCIHNLNYWNHGNYLGFGPSSHSFMNNKRWWNIANLHEYMVKLESGKLPIAGEEILTEEQLIEEAIFLGLRSEGIDFEKFKKSFKRDFLSDYNISIENLVNDGYLKIDAHRLCLTPKGYVFCDEICGKLLSKMPKNP